MNRSTTYDDDILEWSEQQAAALRRLAESRHDISNELDWEHIAEEIEDVGRSELATVQSLTRQILIHLIEAVSVPDPQLTRSWYKEAMAFQGDMLDRISPSMPERIDMDKLWRRALKQARIDLAVHEQSVTPALPERCPLGMQEILDPNFDFLASVGAIRKRLEKGRPTG